jgi:uncharacterized protein (UPF0303 family)
MDFSASRGDKHMLARGSAKTMSLSDDIDRIITQEARLRFPRFNEADAWTLGAKMHAVAEARSLPVTIDIRLAGGRPLFYAALAGSDADNPDWVRRKSNITLRYFKSSYRFGRELAIKGATLGHDRGVDPLDYAPHGGAFPIHVEGTGVIGAVTVSGLPQREDHNFVVEMLCDYLGIAANDLRLPPESAA